ncbi:hypothetical protein [Nocardia wallacei]|uniref:hypothetical protein n=1 Tax=Nocardia wallacei TaxID=480035 RepID=UPI002454E936|nr:hypothetical protein [Nocardia wallacei]
MLLKRGLKRARGGWFFNQGDRPAQNPVRQPWKQWGSNSPGFINASGELELPPASGTNLGGVSYEFMPFTSNYGLEFDVVWPVIGAGESALSLFIMASWARVAVDWDDTLGVRLFHQPVGSGDTVRIQQWNDLTSLSGDAAVGNSPVAYDSGALLSLRVLVDDDRFVRAYLNNTRVAAGTLAPQFFTSAGRRGMNLMNQAAVNARFRRARLYDRTGLIPAALAWSQIFADTFDRANGAAGNGWTTDGTGVGITGNSWGMNTGSPSDGSRGLTRPTGITNGRQRVEATIGGQHGISSSQDSSIILCCNTTRTAGLAANVFSNKAYLSRWTGSLTSPTFTDLVTPREDITLSNGDALAANLYDGTMWLEHNGSRILYADNANAVVPASNDVVGLRVERATFVNSNSWNDIRILAG